MGKAKRRSAEARDVAEAEPVAPAISTEPLRFEVPYTAGAARLINPGLRLASLMPDPARDASYTIDVTLLDAPDHRLIRSGIMLAHRVRDGLGEWYLGATGWQPYFPQEQTEPMGAGELPQRFADLVRPFRRIGALGPIAALSAERKASVLADATGRPLATLRDEKVTVRRGGLTTASSLAVLGRSHCRFVGRIAHSSSFHLGVSRRVRNRWFGVA